MASWKDTAAAAGALAEKREQEAEDIRNRADGAETEQERENLQRQAEEVERGANDSFQQSASAQQEAEREAALDAQQKELQEAEKAVDDWKPHEVTGQQPSGGQGVFDQLTGDIVQGAEERFHEARNEEERQKLETDLNKATPAEPEPIQEPEPEPER